MRAFYFIAILLLVEFRPVAADTTSPTQSPPLLASSRTNTCRSLIFRTTAANPFGTPQTEVTTRTWKAADGQTIRLLSREVVKVGLPTS